MKCIVRIQIPLLVEKLTWKGFYSELGVQSRVKYVISVSCHVIDTLIPDLQFKVPYLVGSIDQSICDSSL